MERINELISIKHFAGHRWLQTLLEPLFFSHQSGSGFEQKVQKSQEKCLLLIQETRCLLSGNRLPVKNVLGCLVTGGRDKFRQYDGNSIPQSTIESNRSNKQFQLTVASATAAETVGLDWCFFSGLSAFLLSKTYLAVFASYSCVRNVWVFVSVISRLNVHVNLTKSNCR